MQIFLLKLENQHQYLYIYTEKEICQIPNDSVASQHYKQCGKLATADFGAENELHARIAHKDSLSPSFSAP